MKTMKRMLFRMVGLFLDVVARTAIRAGITMQGTANEGKGGPTFNNVSCRDLTNSIIPDKFVNCVHINFQSETGRNYTAILVFSHPYGTVYQPHQSGQR